MILPSKTIEEFQKKIINYFLLEGRKFPWRETIDPYKILVSEILLQKTNVRKVVQVYNELIENYPSILDLANANYTTLFEIIKPLGLYNRTDRLINVSKIIVSQYNQIIPNDFNILKSFTGIGMYIATAICVFAFNQKRVVVDTNVIRVINREFGYFSQNKRPRTDMNLWSFVDTLAPETNIKEFNWGLLDYGSIIKKQIIEG